MESIVVLFTQLLNGGISVAVPYNSSGMSTQMAWVMGIGFVAIAVSIASYFDNM